MKIPLIVALDDMEKKEIFSFLKKVHGQIPFIKIGMEAYFRYHHTLLFEIAQSFNLKIFLDLKLHDIPNTVSKAIRSLQGLPLEFLTIHLTGGEEMIKAALIASCEYLPKTKLLGVTYLTSLGKKNFRDLWNFNEKQMQESFKCLVQQAFNTSLHGIVLSPHELNLVTAMEINQKKIIKVCPGIRFADDQIQDQKRVMTPDEAYSHQADYLVMGRSLTKISDDQLIKRLEFLQSIKNTVAI